MMSSALTSRQSSVVSSRLSSAWQLTDTSTSTLDERASEDQIPHSPSEQLARLKDTSKAWVVCFAAFIIQVLDVGVLHVFGVFFVALVEDFGASRAVVGEKAYFLFQFNISFLQFSGLC